MPRALVPALLVALPALLLVPAGASAAWDGPGKCRIPASDRGTWDSIVDTKKNRFSTTKVPCYMAAYTISDMIERKRYTEASFRHRSMGARWVVRLSCTSAKLDAGGRLIKCRVRSGDDAESDRNVTKDLKGGTIRWKTTHSA